MKFREHKLAHDLLDGLRGLEVGAAAHNPFGLQTRNVAPPDDYEFYAEAQEELGVLPASVAIWGTADAIPVPDDSEGFVISSHVVEHLPNVIAAFLEWDRVVRAGGVVFMIVPLQDALPADRGRSVTPLAHFVADYQARMTLDTHPVEDVPGGRMGHYHVFTPDSLVAVVDWMNGQGLTDWRLTAREDVDTKVGNGFTLAFRVGVKPGQSPVRQASSAVPEQDWAPALDPMRQALSEKEFALAQMEEALAHARRDAEGTARAFEEQQQTLARLHRALTDGEEVQREKDLLLAGYASQLEQEQASLGFQALQAARALRNALAPPGGRRWQAYLALRQPLRGLLALGAYLAPRMSGGSGLNRQPSSRPTNLRRLRAECARFPFRPVVSLVTPVYDVPEVWLRRMVESVLGQAYPHWQLCLVNDGSKTAHVRKALDRYANDPRIIIKHLEENEGICGASNHALALTTGEFVGLLDHDDELAPEALYEVVKRLNEEPSLDLLYSDEDKILADGAHIAPLHKPAWNRDLLLACNYITHLCVFRRSLLLEVGGFRPGFDGSQDYDLLLRFTERTSRVGHIPKVLYHWRIIEGSTALSALAKPYAYTAACRALDHALQRCGRAGEVEMQSPGLYRVRYQVCGAARASVLVHRQRPGEAGLADLEHLAQTAGAVGVEVLVVDTSPAGSGCEVVSPWRLCRRPDLNGRTAAALNAAAGLAVGDFLVFLDAGLRPAESGWLEALLEQAAQAGVGAVGARVVGQGGRAIHTGLVLTAGGRLRSSSTLLPKPSLLNRVIYTDVVRQCSAVGGGCLAVARKAFEAAGGFDEQFRQSHHDADLCLRLGRAGWAVVYTPYAVFQEAKKAREVLAVLEDERAFLQRWGESARGGDPHFSPHLLRKVG